MPARTAIDRINDAITKAMTFGRRSVDSWYTVGQELTKLKEKNPSLEKWLLAHRKQLHANLDKTTAYDLVRMVKKTNGDRRKVAGCPSLQRALVKSGVRPDRSQPISHDWRTPRSLFDPLHAAFNFTVDACASKDNALLPRFWTDALKQRWAKERVFCNPQFRHLSEILPLAATAELAVVLMPANATVSPSFWANAPTYLAVQTKRINFDPPPGVEQRGVTFGTVLAVYGEINERQIDVLDDLGTVLKTVRR